MAIVSCFPVCFRYAHLILLDIPAHFNTVWGELLGSPLGRKPQGFVHVLIWGRYSRLAGTIPYVFQDIKTLWSILQIVFSGGLESSCNPVHHHVLVHRVWLFSIFWHYLEAMILFEYSTIYIYIYMHVTVDWSRDLQSRWQSLSLGQRQYWVHLIEVARCECFLPVTVTSKIIAITWSSMSEGGYYYCLRCTWLL